MSFYCVYDVDCKYRARDNKCFATIKQASCCSYSIEKDDEPPKPPTTGSNIVKGSGGLCFQDGDIQAWTFVEEPEEKKWQFNKNKLYKELAAFYGEQKQCLVCIEEMAELTKELIKYERGYEDLDQYDKIAEEVADVEIMLEQVKRIYDIEADVEGWKYEKLKRTRERLDKKRNNHKVV